MTQTLTDFTCESIPVHFGEEGHVYHHTPTGKLFPGVTTILKARGKPWMGPWMLKEAGLYLQREWKAETTYSLTARDAIIAGAKKAHDTKSSFGRDVGTDAHKVVAMMVQHAMKGTRTLGEQSYKVENGNTELLNAPVQSSVNAFLEWEKVHRPEYLLSEQPVCHVLHWYAGTLDVLARIGERVGLIDFKTSSDLYDDYWPQPAAYQRAIEPWINVSVDFRALVQLPKDGKPFKHIEAPRSVEADFEDFMACLVLHRSDQWWKARKDGR